MTCTIDMPISIGGILKDLQATTGHARFQKAFIKSLNNVYELMTKNKYYNIDDFNSATLQAYDIIRGYKFNEFLKAGNLKLAPNVLIFDMPSIITCKGACAHCYALKAERIYKNTRVMRLKNLILIEFSLNYKPFYKILQSSLINEIKLKSSYFKLSVLRLHSSGDFYRQEYLHFWLEIAKKLEKIENIKIYTYTKQLNNDMIDFINENFKNFNIVKSIIEAPNGKKYINFGSNGYIGNIAKMLKKQGIEYHICNYGLKTGHETKCMNNCTACLNCSHVLFHQH